MTDHHRVDVGGIKLAYQVSGRSDGPPLVLLHPLERNSADWDGVAEAFRRHWRVYALDLRGHGNSDWPGEYTLELMRDDVLGFLDTLSLSKVDLIGHSMGGIVAYLLAEEQPPRVNRLVLEDVPPPFPRARTILTKPDGPLSWDWAMTQAIKAQIDAASPVWLEQLDRITAPTLLIGGGPISHLPQEQIAEMARRIPDSQHITIPVGHLIHENAPEQFTQAVLAFLRSDDSE